MSVKRKVGVGSHLSLQENSQIEDNHEQSVPVRLMESPSEANVVIKHERGSSKFWSSVQKTAKGFSNRLSSTFSSQEMSAPRQKPQISEMKIAKKITRNWQRFAAKGKDGIAKDLTTSRHMEPDDSNRYRRGPLAVEDFSGSSLQKTTHGTIDSDDEDDRICRPSSKGLLTYFKELGQSFDEDEKVDLDFVNSLFEAGADINHADRFYYFIYVFTSCLVFSSEIFKSTYELYIFKMVPIFNCNSPML